MSILQKFNAGFDSHFDYMRSLNTKRNNTLVFVVLLVCICYLIYQNRKGLFENSDSDKSAYGAIGYFYILLAGIIYLTVHGYATTTLIPPLVVYSFAHLILIIVEKFSKKVVYETFVKIIAIPLVVYFHMSIVYGRQRR